jgi:hypothetical protein
MLIAVGQSIVSPFDKVLWTGQNTTTFLPLKCPVFNLKNIFSKILTLNDVVVCKRNWNIWSHMIQAQNLNI